MFTLVDFEWMDTPEGHQEGIITFNNGYSIKLVEIKMYNMQTFYIETYEKGKLKSYEWVKEHNLAPADKEGYLSNTGGIVTMSIDYIQYYADEISKL